MQVNLILMSHDFQWRHPYPQAVLNLRCGERLSPPHPLFSVKPPQSRYSIVTKSSKSQVMIISICFINSATHIFYPPPLQEIIVSVAITRYSGCVPIDLDNVLNWSGRNSFLSLGKVFLSQSNSRDFTCMNSIQVSELEATPQGQIYTSTWTYLKVCLMV